MEFVSKNCVNGSLFTVYMEIGSCIFFWCILHLHVPYIYKYKARITLSGYLGGECKSYEFSITDGHNSSCSLDNHFFFFCCYRHKSDSDLQQSLLFAQHPQPNICGQHTTATMNHLRSGFGVLATNAIVSDSVFFFSFPIFTKCTYTALWQICTICTHAHTYSYTLCTPATTHAHMHKIHIHINTCTCRTYMNILYTHAHRIYTYMRTHMYIHTRVHAYTRMRTLNSHAMWTHVHARARAHTCIHTSAAAYTSPGMAASNIVSVIRGDDNMHYWAILGKNIIALSVPEGA